MDRVDSLMATIIVSSAFRDAFGILAWYCVGLVVAGPAGKRAAGGRVEQVGQPTPLQRLALLWLRLPARGFSRLAVIAVAIGDTLKQWPPHDVEGLARLSGPWGAVATGTVSACVGLWLSWRTLHKQILFGP